MWQLIVVVWALSTEASAVDCAASVSVDTVERHLDDSEQGYSRLDVEGFSDSLDAAVFGLPCLDAVMSPPLVARYHALMGIRLLTDRLEDDARQAFVASRRADPTYTLPEDLLPVGHQARDLFDQATTLAVRKPVPRPKTATLWFDGVDVGDRPTDHPSIVQVEASDGTVEATRYVLPSDALPPYEAIAPLPGSEADEGRIKRPLSGKRIALLGTAAAFTATSVGLYMAGVGSATEFARPLPPDQGLAELEALQRRTNLFVAGSALSGGLAAVGVVGFVVVR